MGFLSSAVNQVGRDMGKVVSNKVFKDAHASPIRMTRSSYTNRVNTSDLYKALSFQTSFRPTTLVNKMAGAYTALKNLLYSFMEDNYIDLEEESELFKAFDGFNGKLADVAEILDLDTSKNTKEITQLEVILQKSQTIFLEALEMAAKSSETDSQNHKQEADAVQEPSFLLTIIYSVLVMPASMESGRIRILKDIPWMLFGHAFAIGILYLFPPIPWVYIFLVLLGAYSFVQEKKKRKSAREALSRLASLHAERHRNHQALYTELKENTWK